MLNLFFSKVLNSVFKKIVNPLSADSKDFRCNSLPPTLKRLKQY